MSERMVEGIAITKRYGSFIALDNVTIQLKRGEIYGLIGKNGAGKTTLMRTLAGLSVTNSGRIVLFGKESKKGLAMARKKMGCMIENPSIVPYMSAKENLQLHQTLRGLQKSNCDSELKNVGLMNNPKKKAKDFSLGMKQRLGIAIALLGDPEVLILDEPINGLDPVGVAEMRDLIINLCRKKKMTILISSHNLPELYQVATQYIFIDNGKLIRSMNLQELEKESNPHLLISCNHLDELKTVLQSVLHTNNFKIISENTIELYDFLDRTDYVSEVLVNHDIAVTNFNYQEETLENYFLSLVGGIHHDGIN